MTEIDLPFLDGHRAQEHDDIRDELADALGDYQTRHMVVCEHTQIISYGDAADQLMSAVVRPRLERYHDAWIHAERAGVAAVDLNKMLRQELHTTANRLDHIPVPETAHDARRQVRTAAQYLRTLAGLSAVAVAERARAGDAPCSEIPVQPADVAAVLSLFERLGATAGDEYTAAALERLGRAVRVAEGEEPVPS